MQLALSAVVPPSRTYVEVDREGTRRTFWLWLDGAWVVACERPNEAPRCACSPARSMRMIVGETVLTLVVVDTSRLTTVPAPASGGMPVLALPRDSVPFFSDEVLTTRDPIDGEEPATVRIVP